MELINKDTPQVKEFISSLDSMLDSIESIVKHYKPHLNGERFLFNNEVSKKLNVSLRTLQVWWDTGLIPFIQIKGKIIYRQSDIDKLLQKHYFESWKELPFNPENIVFRNLIWIIDFSSEVFSLCKSLDENTLEHSERKIFI